MSKTTWSCGFCSVGRHARCPGAARNLGKILRCGCGCVDGRCLACGNRNHDELNGWACADPQACADTIAARTAANPLREELEIVRLMGGEARRLALHERLVRQIQADVKASGIDDEIGHDVAADLGRKPRKPRQPKTSRPTSGTCVCGCAGTTKGGRFQPGHDARLKSQLRKAASGGDHGAVQRLIELGWENYIPADAPAELALVG